VAVSIASQSISSNAVRVIRCFATRKARSLEPKTARRIALPGFDVILMPLIVHCHPSCAREEGSAE
jgi:hypothetical protein